MLNAIADYFGVEPRIIIYCLFAFVILFIFVWIKISRDEKKGVNSQEKADIRNLVDNVIPDGNRYMAAYANHTDMQRGNSVKYYTYFYFAIAFRPEQTDHMWLIPISYKGRKLSYSDPMRMDVETVSHISGDRIKLSMHHLATSKTYHISVDESNTRMGKECQVNIQQPEEAEAYKTFSVAFRDRVNEQRGVDKKGRRLVDQ